MGCCISNSKPKENLAESALIKLLETMNMSTLNYDEVNNIFRKHNPSQDTHTAFKSLYRILPKNEKVDPIRYELLISQLINEKIFEAKEIDYLRCMTNLNYCIEKEFVFKMSNKIGLKFTYINKSLLNEYDALEHYMQVKNNENSKLKSITHVIGGRRSSLLASGRPGIEKISSQCFNFQRAIFPNYDKIVDYEYQILLTVFAYISKENLYPLEIVKIIFRIIKKAQTKSSEKRNITHRTFKETIPLHRSISATRTRSKSNITVCLSDKINIPEHDTCIDFIDHNPKSMRDDNKINNLNETVKPKHNFRSDSYDLTSNYTDNSTIDFNLNPSHFNSNRGNDSSNPFSVYFAQFCSFLSYYLKFNLYHVTKNFYKYMQSEPHFTSQLCDICKIGDIQNFKADLAILAELYYNENAVNTYVDFIKTQLLSSVCTSNLRISNDNRSVVSSESKYQEYFLEFVESNLYLFNISTLRENYMAFFIKSKEDCTK